MNLVRKTLLVALTCLVLITAITVSRPADPASAHPLGEFTVNHFSELEFTDDSVRIEYVVDYAELSTLEQIRRIDGAHGDELEESDLHRYLDELVPQLLEGLDLEIDGEMRKALIQTGKIDHFPLVLMGRDYWQPLLDFMKNRLVENRTIDPHDYDLIFVTDSPADAIDHITSMATEKFGFEWKKRPVPSAALGERA
jgi:hypothetical protein